MAITTTYPYTLQTDETAGGRMTFVLHSAISGLTIPAKTIYSASPSGEDVDILPGEVHVDEYTIEFQEDYSTYQEGFWFKAVSYTHLTLPTSREV